MSCDERPGGVVAIPRGAVRLGTTACFVRALPFEHTFAVDVGGVVDVKGARLLVTWFARSLRLAPPQSLVQLDLGAITDIGSCGRAALRDLVVRCGHDGHRILVVNDERLVVEWSGARPFSKLRNAYPRWGKRLLDIVLSALLLAVALPIVAVACLGLRITVGRSTLITQDRVGRDGATFGMLKLRTMLWSRRRSDEPIAIPDRRATHKSDHDPRHTPLGRVLRQLSIDELPQLWNVLRGDMSLVGPRPELAHLVDGLGLRDHPRHLIRPGITGEWQVTARAQGQSLLSAFDDDVAYLSRISLRHDLRILWATFGVVAGRTGR